MVVFLALPSYFHGRPTISLHINITFIPVWCPNLFLLVLFEQMRIIIGFSNSILYCWEWPKDTRVCVHGPVSAFKARVCHKWLGPDGEESTLTAMKTGKTLQIHTLLVTSLMEPKFHSAAWSTKQDKQLDCIFLTLLSCCLESSISTPYALVLIWTIQGYDTKSEDMMVLHDRFQIWVILHVFLHGVFCL